MKHVKLFETSQEYDEFFNKESMYVTSITCDGEIYTYEGKSGNHYYKWYSDNNNITLITFVRNPGVGEWNPALGTGAYLDSIYNWGVGETSYEITSRETVNTSPDDYYIEPLISITDIKAININNKWYEYVGEFDVYQGVYS